MNPDDFHVKLIAIREMVRQFIAQDLDATQHTYLGAELHDLARVIIEKYAMRGYRRRD